MSYTPKFKKILDQIEVKAKKGATDEELQIFFKDSCIKLGAYERINNLYRIRPKRPVPGESSRLQFFRMNKMQELYWKAKTNRDLILKMRQGGITTLSCLIALDKALWEDGSRSAIMADTKDHVKEYFTITKTAFRSFQKDWGQFYTVTEDIDNVNALKIKETGASLLVCTNARGLTLDFLHVAEAAFIPDAEISDSMEAVPLSGWIILETTADTASGIFYELWDRSQKDSQVLFKSHFFEWWIRYPEPEDMQYIKVSPDFKLTNDELILAKEHDLTNEQIIWRRLKISECKGDVGEFLRKYPEDPMTCFLSGAMSVFPPDVLAALLKNERVPSFVGDLILGESKNDVKFQLRPFNDLKEYCGYKIWQKPKPTGIYAIGVDVAEGVGGDASCANVIDCSNGSHVAQYWSNSVDVNTYAAELYKLGMYYNKAAMCIENNNHGHAIIALMGGAPGSLAYPNLYKTITYNEFSQKRERKIGFTTSSSTKPRIIENLKTALKVGEAVSYDKFTILELSSFVRDQKTGRMGAKGKAKDDRVMSWCLAWEQARLIRETVNAHTSAETPQMRFDPMTGFPLGY